MRRFLAGLVLGCWLALPAFAQTVTLDFEDGAGGALVDAQYAAQGVTFQDAGFVDRSPTALAGMSGSIGIYHASTQFQWGPATPIIATFGQPATSVSVDGIDVGTQGFVLTAYDAVSGGNVVATQQVFGSAVGVGQFFTLTVTGSAIRRVQISQVTTGGGDGMLLDNFRVTFGGPATVAPVPTLEFGALAGLAGLMVLGTALHRRRQRL